MPTKGRQIVRNKWYASKAATDQQKKTNFANRRLFALVIFHFDPPPKTHTHTQICPLTAAPHSKYVTHVSCPLLCVIVPVYGVCLCRTEVILFAHCVRRGHQQQTAAAYNRHLSVHCTCCDHVTITHHHHHGTNTPRRIKTVQINPNHGYNRIARHGVLVKNIYYNPPSVISNYLSLARLMRGL